MDQKLQIANQLQIANGKLKVVGPVVVVRVVDESMEKPYCSAGGCIPPLNSLPWRNHGPRNSKG